MTSEAFDDAIKEYSQRQEEKRRSESTPISVSEALRKQGGRHTVQGIIVSRSDIYNLITKTIISCNNCHESTEHKHKQPEHSINEAKYRKCSACGDIDIEISHEYLSGDCMDSGCRANERA